jgi:hypothetical protein
MRKITQALAQYKEKIKEFEECTVPNTPPIARVQREKYTTKSTTNIAQHIHIVEKLQEKSNQLWKQLLEDMRLQEMKVKEDKLHAIMKMSSNNKGQCHC